jgi:hypothetical protein
VLSIEHEDLAIQPVEGMRRPVELLERATSHIVAGG